jgi:hypothetical protein
MIYLNVRELFVLVPGLTVSINKNRNISTGWRTPPMEELIRRLKQMARDMDQYKNAYSLFSSPGHGNISDVPFPMTIHQV